MTEYAFIGALGLVCCLTAVSFLGQQLDLSFLGLKAQTLSQINQSDQITATHADLAESMKKMQDKIDTAILRGDHNAKTIEVTAANGDTETGLYVKDYDLNPTADPSTLSPDQIKAMVQNMSNQTYLIAALEKQMLSLLKYAKDNPTKFMNITIHVKGQKVPVMVLAIAIQTQVTKLLAKQAKLNASNATAEDKTTMDNLVATVTGDAAAIYSKTQNLQASYLQNVTHSSTTEAVQTARDDADTAAETALATKATADSAAQNSSKSADKMCETGHGSSSGASCG